MAYVCIRGLLILACGDTGMMLWNLHNTRIHHGAIMVHHPDLMIKFTFPLLLLD